MTPDPLVLGPDAAPELHTLQRAAYLSEAIAHDDFHLPPLVETVDDIRAVLTDADTTVLGLREAGRLVASVRLRRVGDVVELGRLMVAPGRQGRGLGSRLLDAAEALPGVREIRLFTGEHSHGNLRLYRRVGYRETGRSRAGHYDLVHFVKPLG